jgi:hypothetical protein
VTGVVALMIVMLLVQMWLLSATLDAFLAHDDAAALPGAIISGLLFVGCGALYVLIVRLDRRRRGRS